MPQSRRLNLLLTIWCALNLLAAPLLYVYCWVDTSFSGTNLSERLPFPYEPASQVQYSLLGYRYLIDGQLVTGPHYHLPLVIGWLGISALVLWLLRNAGERAQRMLRINLTTLALVVLLGGPLLAWGQARHNTLRATPTQGLSRSNGRVTASPLWLSAWQCTRWSVPESQGCLTSVSSHVPNPAGWGGIGTLLMGLAGLHGARKASSLNVPLTRSGSVGDT